MLNHRWSLKKILRLIVFSISFPLSSLFGMESQADTQKPKSRNNGTVIIQNITNNTGKHLLAFALEDGNPHVELLLFFKDKDKSDKNKRNVNITLKKKDGIWEAMTIYEIFKNMSNSDIVNFIKDNKNFKQIIIGKCQDEDLYGFHTVSDEDEPFISLVFDKID